MIESARDLVMSNSTKGFENLAEEFTFAADMIDPTSVEWALEDAGIPFMRQRGGGVILDLTSRGMGQMAFRQAVQQFILKLSRNGL